MAHTIMTPDGPRTFLSRRDMLEVAEQYISKDYADLIDDVTSIIDEEERRTELEFYSDYLAYEQSCEEYHSLLLDIQEELQDIKGHIDNSQRLNRDKLYKSIKDIAERIQLYV